MRWKTILAVFLIFGIAGMLFFTQHGRNFLLLIQEKLPSGLSSLFSLTQLQDKKYFSFSLRMERNLLSYSFEAVNSSLLAKGKEITILVNGIPLNIPENSVLRLEDGKGSISINEKVKGSLSVKKIYVDGITYGPSNLKTEFEINAPKIVIGGLKKDLLAFSSISCELQQIAEDGSIKQNLNLENDELSISNFFGAIKLEENSAYLQGYATKIRGKIKGVSFEWAAS
jgi:hypothetical protein